MWAIIAAAALAASAGHGPRTAEVDAIEVNHRYCSDTGKPMGRQLFFRRWLYGDHHHVIAWMLSDARVVRQSNGRRAVVWISHEHGLSVATAGAARESWTATEDDPEIADRNGLPRYLRPGLFVTPERLRQIDCGCVSPYWDEVR